MPIQLLIFFLVIIGMPFIAKSQNGGYTLFRSFTVADGLPSNHIYNCVEDNNGFLWVTTDAGISRFDGKHFQNFTTKDGLPDDEVLDAVKENNGRIWVNCFKQGPAYFDQIKNRFVNSKLDTNLSIVKGTKGIQLISLREGGVMYWNELGTYFFVDGKPTQSYIIQPGFSVTKIIQRFGDGSSIAGGMQDFQNKLFFLRAGKAYDSISLGIWNTNNNVRYLIQDDQYYLSKSDEGITYRFSEFQTDPFRYRVDSVSIGMPMLYARITPKYLTVMSRDGNIFLFEKESLRPEFVLSGNYFPSSVYTDSKENIWVCSIDKGLLLYKKKYVTQYASPDNFINTNFLSIARKWDGVVLAGNLYGQIAETDGKYFTVHSLQKTNNTAWQRKIIISKNKIFSFGEGGTYINFSVPVLDSLNKPAFSKTAAVLNDSIIIRGAINVLDKLNTITGKTFPLPTINKRTTCVGIAGGNIVYHGSTDGLYKYDLTTQQDISVAYKHPLLAERIIGICSTTDGLVWVATASNGVMALQNDNVLKVFTTVDGIISSNIKCISSGKAGELWIGTNKGITIIRYKSTPAAYSYQNITINDGLNSNIINEMLFDKDTMYCATGNGICAIPANIRLVKFDIPVRLTGITINSKDTAIADKYILGYDQNNIELHVAGVELGGHFNYFQYRVDKAEWQILDATTLVLQLNSGKHIVRIRAVDVNGNTGTNPLVISFTITTPFWKSFWFWGLVVLLLGGSIVWIWKKRETAKREAALQSILNQKKLTELELQALKSQINPHFIFNCLNSIKLLNHRQQYAEAEKYLDSFAALLRSALEQSSLQQITLEQEMEFIENYLALEKLRLPGKLSYTIEADKNIITSKLLIPSMLLQPYIENAIKHGIAPLKNKQGLVQVKFHVKDDLLIAEVQDNGNGIHKTPKGTAGTGIGILNTERRSRLYNIESQFTDLHSIDVNLTGTLVQLKIPLPK